MDVSSFIGEHSSMTTSVESVQDGSTGGSGVLGSLPVLPGPASRMAATIYRTLAGYKSVNP
jgi:hypothetical protein